ncbi:MAG: helix-turn-helix domain-containing protein [Pseudonocardiaceae bacterium]
MGSRPARHRYCRCGTHLAADNNERQCARCQRASRDKLIAPPQVPSEFWQAEQLRDAFTAQHIGRVARAYRTHPHHHTVYGPSGISQTLLGHWLGLRQPQISRIETGLPIRDLDTLVYWARVLRIPAELLWFDLPGQTRQPALSMHNDQAASAPGQHRDDQDSRRSASPVLDAGEHGYPGTDDMNHHRELLRLLAITGASLAASHPADGADWDRMDHAVRTARLDAATADEYAALNAQLWHIFAVSQTKSVIFPLVRSQLGVLTNALQQTHSSAMRQRLSGFIADLLQLAGEISFDANHYTDAAYCYTLAATASKEAAAFDLWACAMTRHAFIGVYERQFDKALPMLTLAGDLARNGDSTLSTRHWVSTVQAHAFAGLGDLDACEKSLDDAEHVTRLSGRVHNSGWLRFDGSRLAEERGTCYVELGRTHLAETVLDEAMRQNLSPRRRGSVLTNLAMTGVQRGDPERILTYASTALDTARQTHSGVIGRRLRNLQTHLAPFLDNSHIRQLNIEITNHISASIT